ncbi:hypothetical protein QIT00_29055 [Streptomyces sp. B-S-A12]|uniref:Uncharacterized protein n=1 Tax=Streptomyces luteolus TaxID=3043615 RepID=A0ABT6T3W2_9ACTN|nr:hypothetical protein [Streptomyces sp. B-S-A12]MDI3422546.1 hypothetical protein [Streptomyces sp. B-S-A12]
MLKTKEVANSAKELDGSALASRKPFTKTPYTLRGENAPAMPPWTTIMPIISWSILYRRANGMASGATHAMAKIAPIDIRIPVSEKKIQGAAATLPRTSRRPHLTNRSTVPFRWANPGQMLINPAIGVPAGQQA